MENQQTFPAGFGDPLKTFRKRKRLTQKQLAQYLSVHTNTISSWELGTYLPATSGLVLELARLLTLNDQETRQLLEGSLTALSPHSVIATIELACQRAAQRHPKALDLLHFCAFVSPDTIPEGLLLRSVSCPGLVLEPVTTNPTQLDQAIAALRSLSLVQRHPETQSLSLHRLVQTVLRELMSEQEHARWKRRVTAVLNIAFPESAYEAWEECERLLPHVLACAAATSNHSKNQNLAEVLRKAADYLRDRVRYEQAEPLLEQAMCIRKQVCGPRHPDLARSIYNLAMLSAKQGKEKEAEVLYQQTLYIGEQAWGLEHPEVADVLEQLVELNMKQGKHEQAELYLKRACTIFEHHLGQTHPRTVKARSFYHNMMEQHSAYYQGI